ncbi:hypothetical protein J3458_015529 [Metarhizium acridum]|uniref:uncharacterized protein n=1 Tax=Metarhizium acridum TaxID=92637 RepID=UPI001C6CA909|nr:hypothetical protein J3458_015529 [Metarhizium acridum]
MRWADNEMGVISIRYILFDGGSDRSLPNPMTKPRLKNSKGQIVPAHSVETSSDVGGFPLGMLANRLQNSMYTRSGTNPAHDVGGRRIESRKWQWIALFGRHATGVYAPAPPLCPTRWPQDIYKLKSTALNIATS